MGQIQNHSPVLWICALISRHQEAHHWAEEKLVEQLGDVAIASPAFEFQETSFYEATMGADLTKRFLAFEQLGDPAGLADLKIKTNELESSYRATHENSEERPLNLDPGYISNAKLVLATTKDRDHRVYLQRGIFAEVTLHYRRTGWTLNPWTYPNYQRADFHEFFTRCREYYRAQKKSR
jgi:hypothetical protein